MALLRERLRQKRDKREYHTHPLHKMADAWDDLMLREGDTAARRGPASQPSEDDHRPHKNQYRETAFLRMAFDQVGEKGGQRPGGVGIMDSHRGQESLTTVTGAFCCRQETVSIATADKLRDSSGCICLHHDGTPMHLRYGATLQHLLEPHARYLLATELPDGRKIWKAVSYTEYRKFFPRRYLRAGVLEVFAQSVDVTWRHDVGEMQTQIFHIPPRILQNGKGSTIFRATESALPALSLRHIMSVANTLGSWIFYHEVPDSLKANKRKQAKTKEILLPAPTVLYPENPGCTVHGLHNHAEKIIGIKTMTGDVHACQYVTTISSRKDALMRSGRTLLSTELDVRTGSPPPECSKRTWTLLNHTVLRAMRHVTAKAHLEDPANRDKHDKLYKTKLTACKDFASMFNGDLREGRAVHWENNCCVDASGNYSFEVCVENCLAALTNLGLFGGLETGIVRKDRWGSRAAHQALLICGIMVHNLIPRTWKLAFPWKGAGRFAEADDSFHQVLKGKAYRGQLVLNSAVTNLTWVLISVTSETIDWLLQAIQHHDAAGGILRLMVLEEKNLFAIAQRRLFKLLETPMNDSELSLVLYHYGQNLEVRQHIADEMTSLMLGFGAAMFYYEHLFKQFPFKFVEGVVDECGVERQMDMWREAKTMRRCCSSLDCTWKMVAAIPPETESLCDMPHLYRAVDCWSHAGKISDMSSERLLSLIRKGSPKNSTVERLVSAGTLTQLMRVHRLCGGEDPTKTRRQQLLEDGVPLRAQPRVKQSSKRRASLDFINSSRKRMKLERGSEVLPRASALEELRACAREFKALPAQQRPRPQATSQAMPEKMVDASKYDEKVGTKLHGLSTQRFPLSPKSLRSIIAEAVPREEKMHGPRPSGLTDRLEPLRERLTKQIFVKDQGDIASTEKFINRLTCAQAFGELCAEGDCLHWDIFKAIDVGMHNMTSGDRRGMRYKWVVTTQESIAPFVGYFCKGFQDDNFLFLVKCTEMDGVIQMTENLQKPAYRFSGGVIKEVLENTRAFAHPPFAFSLQRLTTIPAVSSPESCRLTQALVSGDHAPPQLLYDSLHPPAVAAPKATAKSTSEKAKKELKIDAKLHERAAFFDAGFKQLARMKDAGDATLLAVAIARATLTYN